MELMKKRVRMSCCVLGAALMMELGVLVYQSGLAKGLNPRADKLKIYAAASRDDATILPGDFYDRNGLLLVETAVKPVETTNGDGEKVTKSERTTVYRDGRAYSQVIGYTGPRDLNPLAPSADQVIGARRGYRLMDFMDDDCWGKNGLYSTVNADGIKGQNVVLTLDHELQLQVYQALKKEMDEQEDRGSAVVMDAKTGEILAMTAFPAYDFGDLSTALAQMEEAEKEKGLEPAYPVTSKGAETPGSIFKILTAVSLIDHGMEDFTVTDQPFMVNGWLCRNSYSGSGGEISYYKALEQSSNVFYAQAALALGRDGLRETAEKFMLIEDRDGDEKDDTYLSLDFGYVEYSWDLDVEDDMLAQTGFGQGKTELTTIYAAMITQAIANDGVMMKPYLISQLTDAGGKTVYTGKPEVLSRATRKATADKVTEAMEAAAVYSCTCRKGLETEGELFKRLQVAGKTGTAENGDAEDTLNAWFVSFAPADDPRYVVVVNQCKADKGGWQMITAAADIYRYLFESAPQ